MDFLGNDGRLLVDLLSAASLRARVISDNIANQETPGFRRRLVRFEEDLAEALRAGDREALQRIQPQIEVDRTAEIGPDGNSVSLETETSAMRENRLLYELYASMLDARFDLVRTSIVESR